MVKSSLTIHAYLSPTSPPDLTIQQVSISSWPALRDVLKGRETVYVANMQANETIQADLDGMQMKQWATALKASRSWLDLPLLAGERTIGLLNILT